ncbi:MAG: single-stranded-DNA-specific exonuclease RecJ [Hahellaceae bacterium]|nr:single-stranded-DNA-specific exonuclease RecJ [Hahellaceae bacterium]
MNPGIQRRRLPADMSGLATLSPLLRRIYATRGVSSLSELDHSLTAMAAPAQMKGIDRAASILAEAVIQRQRLLIVGDFDCDGATSTALGVLALRALGAAHVDFLVPDRFKYGYGLTPEIVAVACERKPDVLITVDNGIASIEGVKAARAAGITVVVTDHHLPGEILPDADAIVNPNQGACDFSSKAAAGVGVIFCVMTVLRKVLRERHWFAETGLKEPNMAQFLDLVALGTVADVVPLDQNNRVFVEQGIRRIRAGNCRPGIRALVQIAGREMSGLTPMDLGFVVGPRLNAAGRLEDMSVGIECLITTSEQRAFDVAKELDSLNQARKQIEQEMKAHAEVLVDEWLTGSGGELPWGLCLYDESWHQGVIGLLASRMKERLHRPVIAFAPADDDAVWLKGSARSIPGLHIRDTLDRVATQRPDILTKFGGHAMAAGMTVAAEHFDEFCRLFDSNVKAALSESDLKALILTDGALAPEELTLETAQMLRLAGPWGQQFPEPVFDGEFLVIQSRVLGGRHLKLVLGLPGHSVVFDAIAFQTEWADGRSLPARVHIVYRPDVNEFRGETRLQLLITHLSPAPVSGE